MLRQMRFTCDASNWYAFDCVCKSCKWYWIFFFWRTDLFLRRNHTFIGGDGHAICAYENTCKCDITNSAAHNSILLRYMNLCVRLAVMSIARHEIDAIKYHGNYIRIDWGGRDCWMRCAKIFSTLVLMNIVITATMKSNAIPFHLTVLVVVLVWMAGARAHSTISSSQTLCRVLPSPLKRFRWLLFISVCSRCENMILESQSINDGRWWMRHRKMQTHTFTRSTASFEQNETGNFSAGNSSWLIVDVHTQIHRLW